MTLIFLGGRQTGFIIVVMETVITTSSLWWRSTLDRHSASSCGTPDFQKSYNGWYAFIISKKKKRPKFVYFIIMNHSDFKPWGSIWLLKLFLFSDHDKSNGIFFWWWQILPSFSNGFYLKKNKKETDGKWACVFFLAGICLLFRVPRGWCQWPYIQVLPYKTAASRVLTFCLSLSQISLLSLDIYL